jgi:hypothetical protein
MMMDRRIIKYVVVILAFVFLVATILRFAAGRKVYTGPITEVLGGDICRRPVSPGWKYWTGLEMEKEKERGDWKSLLLR